MDHMRVRARAAVLGFGRRVREHRLAAGISQTELGRRARVTDKFIGQIERGESNPSLVSMVLVAGALECELADLLPRGNGAASVAIPPADMRRVQEAVAVLGSVFPGRTRAPRTPRLR